MKLGDGLTREQIQEGNMFLSEQKALYIVVASQLRLKNEEYFPTHMFHDDILRGCSSTTWWTSVGPTDKLDSDTIKFATKLMRLPAGSADIERHFSALGNIMNVRRGRLGLEKASKLCVIYKNLAGKNAPSDDGGDWDLHEADE